MTPTSIPLSHLLVSFIPVLAVVFFFYRWSLNWKELLYASFRMLMQLLLIGYVLTYIFQQNSPWWTLLIITIMIAAASWISLHSVRKMRREKLWTALISLFFGATPVLILVTAFVIPTTPWYAPSFIIPIAGMIFSNSMNTIGLAAERFDNEIKNKSSFELARQRALSACLIPQVNSFLAVGIVSLPGMMTGQILSGVDPLLAVRYQIVVMTMVLGAGGLSAVFYLVQSKKMA